MKKIFALLIFVIVLPSVFSQPFNTSGIDNADNIFEFASELNTLVGGIVGIGLLLTAFVITFSVVSQRYLDPLAGFGAGSFITVLSATLFMPLGLIGFNIYKIVLLISGISIAATILLRR